LSLFLDKQNSIKIKSSRNLKKKKKFILQTSDTSKYKINGNTMEGCQYGPRPINAGHVMDVNKLFKLPFDFTDKYTCFSTIHECIKQNEMPYHKLVFELIQQH